jgi:crotonobetainyl-CoA:carnitine CoA-transferase CaiB-like acyl-CoA transferase
LWNTLNDLGVPAGPIYSIADIANDPQFQARGMIREMDDPELGRMKVPGIAPRLSETPGVLKWTGPAKPGSHNEEIYTTLLEMSAAEIAQLAEDGII